MEFASFGLDRRLSAALADRGFAVTTPVQSAVYPSVLRGDDLIACAQTGTGKTLAFLLPLMQRMLTSPSPDRRATRVLVLAPTRELAVQIEEEFQGLAYHTPLGGAAVYGGVGMGPQERALRGGVDVVVATPGRLMDHMRGGVGFDGLEVLILDEADRMLDMGFWPDVRRIVSALPDARQTLFFSATTSPDVMKAALQIMRDPKMVRIGGQTGLATTITHVGHVMPREEKAAWLAGFLRSAEGPTIVFVRTKRWADRLARRLGAGRVRVAALHADRSQAQRTAAVEGFKSGRYGVLVATDIAARGLDIDSVGHVVNYEVPTSVDTYVHRVGRTGRAEASGTAVTLVAPEELDSVRDIERALNVQLVGGRAS